MRVIVGLGNPGHTFHGTRHNVGFDVIERFGKHRGIQVTQRLVHSADGRPAAVYGDDPKAAGALRLLMPLTMMNESGDALKGLQTATQDLLIVCDDVNLPLGRLRLRASGSAGGHHGLESCLATLGTEQVARLRIGVGVDPLPHDLHDFVLSRFASSERPVIQQAVEQAVEACEMWMKDGIEVAMNRYNSAQDA